MESPIYWMQQPLKKYADFNGRARRMEYWMFVLLNIAVSIVATILDRILGLAGSIGGVYGPITVVASLALLVPGIAVTIRRLHDTNRVGWWILLPAIPYIIAAVVLASGNLTMGSTIAMIGLVGAIALLVFMVLEGTRGPNDYGPDPKGGTDAGVTV